jgi:Protein of unknown function (DUF3631)
VGSKALIAELVADAEKPWAEWSHGRPISEKGVAQLLHEFGIKPDRVGPKDLRLRGYEAKWFEEAWDRYLEPEKESETPLKEGPQVSTRPSPCNHYAFDDNSSVHQRPGGQEENAELSSKSNAVDRWTGKGGQNGSARVFSASTPREDAPQNGKAQHAPPHHKGLVANDS